MISIEFINLLCVFLQKSFFNFFLCSWIVEVKKNIESLKKDSEVLLLFVPLGLKVLAKIILFAINYAQRKQTDFKKQWEIQLYEQSHSTLFARKIFFFFVFLLEERKQSFILNIFFVVDDDFKWKMIGNNLCMICCEKSIKFVTRGNGYVFSSKNLS